MLSTRQLAAIMFTDIVGYTTLMGKDEGKAFNIIHKNRRLQKPLIEQCNGRWIKELGDGVLASFPTASEAVLCAIKIQNQCNAANDFRLRIGIHQGEVVFEEADIFGDAVNIASRIQALAPVGGIWVSQSVYHDIANKQEIATKFVKEVRLKNVQAAVGIYEIEMEVAGSKDTTPVAKPFYFALKRRLSKSGRRMLTIFIVIIAVAIGYFFYYASIKSQTETLQTSAAEANDKSIAVLPFVNMSNDPQQEYFAEGMMNEVLNHLFKIGGLRITSRTSAMAHKGTKKTMKEISRELGATNLLEGSVQKEGQKIRIRVQLIDGKIDKQLWAETYEREFKDVFGIQSDIAQKVAAALKAQINPEVKKRMEFVPTTNTEAYNLYLQAIDDKTVQFEKRKGILEKVVKLDNSFADAYSELGLWWLFAGAHGGSVTSEDVLTNAMPLLKKALQLNPDLAMAHRNAAMADLWYRWDFNAVEKEYRKVIELNPSNTIAFSGFTDFLLATERFEEALEVTKQALISNRNFDLLWGDLAVSYYFNNNPQKSIETIETAFSLFPGNGYMILNSIRLKLYMNKYEEVIRIYEKYYPALNEKTESIRIGYAAIAYFKTNKKTEAEKLLTELKARSRKSPVGSPSFFIAAVYSALGQNDLAIQWLEKGYKNHEVEMYWLKVEPPFRPLHKDARFQNIINRIGYPNA
jgi:adenylate cyclase